MTIADTFDGLSVNQNKTLIEFFNNKFKLDDFIKLINPASSDTAYV